MKPITIDDILMIDTDKYSNWLLTYTPPTRELKQGEVKGWQGLTVNEKRDFENWRKFALEAEMIGYEVEGNNTPLTPQRIADREILRMLDYINGLEHLLIELNALIDGVSPCDVWHMAQMIGIVDYIHFLQGVKTGVSAGLKEAGKMIADINNTPVFTHRELAYYYYFRIKAKIIDYFPTIAQNCIPIAKKYKIDPDNFRKSLAKMQHPTKGRGYTESGEYANIKAITTVIPYLKEHPEAVKIANELLRTAENNKV